MLDLAIFDTASPSATRWQDVLLHIVFERLRVVAVGDAEDVVEPLILGAMNVRISTLGAWRPL